jgi:hypothetical protein
MRMHGQLVNRNERDFAEMSANYKLFFFLVVRKKSIHLLGRAGTVECFFFWKLEKKRVGN